MSALKTLILMQLKDKIDFSAFKSVKRAIFKVVLSILKFVLITGIIFVAFYVVDYLRIISSLPGIPQNFFTVVFTFVLLISIVVAIAGLVKSLYFAKDNQLLLTFPASRTTVFTSKLLVFYIYELLRNIYFIIPWLIAYGIINSVPFYFYLMLPIAWIVLTALTVSVATLLSIPTMYVFTFIKQYKWLEYIFLVCVITGIVFALVAIINAIPENFDLISQWVETYWVLQDFMTKFITIFLPFKFIVIALVGERYATTVSLFTKNYWLSLLGVILSIAVILGITYLLVRPLFFKMTSSPFEYKKSQIKKQLKNKRVNGFVSFVKKELILTYRTPSKFYDLLTAVLGLPLAILLLNKIYASMDTRLSGMLMSVVFNIMIILIMALSSNASISKTYSEEGASSYLIKTNPKPYLYSTFAKLFVNIACMSISIFASVFIFGSFVHYSFGAKLEIFLFIEFVYLAHLFMSADLDIMNPQTAHYQTTGSHINNPNEVKSSIYGFVISAIMSYLTYFFISDNMNSVWRKMMLIALVFCALRVWLYVNKVKVYYKERQ